MSMEPGGYACKIGNRYERLWIVRQIIDLLNEKITSVIIEDVGDDEKGVDLWITHKDGHKEAQQCKYGNTLESNWSIASLNSRGVLKSIIYQLDRDPSNEFSFISSIGALQLQDLIKRAKDSGGIASVFLTNQIEPYREQFNALKKLCECIEIDINTKYGIDKVYQYLKSIDIHQFQDNYKTQEDIKTFMSFLFTGDSSVVLASIINYIENNLRKEITAPEIYAYLNNLGLTSKRLLCDSRTVQVIRDLVVGFKETINPGLISGTCIQRPESDQIINQIYDDRNTGIFIVHGAAGIGKSVVLYQIVERLEQDKNLVLPVRLDRQIPIDNTSQFGKALGLPDTPVLCLSLLAGNKISVLVIDQLDAIRWTDSHSANALDVVKSLVREVKSLRNDGHRISIIFSSRTFDYQNDPEIRSLFISKDKPFEIQIENFTEDIIKSVLKRYKIEFSELNIRQKLLLGIPFNLSLFVSILDTGRPATIDFNTSTGLMRIYWDKINRELERAGQDVSKVHDVLLDIADKMGNNGLQSLPVHRVKLAYRKILDHLQSRSIIRVDQNKLMFYHQCYLDYLIAASLYNQICDKQVTILEWLGPKIEQSFFKREKLKQLLFLLSDDNLTEFERSIKTIIDSKEVRFHFKHLTLSIIGQIKEPWGRLIDFVIDLLKIPGLKKHIIDLIFFSHPEYIKPLYQTGVLQNWLECTEQDDINNALHLLWSINTLEGDFISEVLYPFTNRGENWTERILNILPTELSMDSESLFSLRLKIIELGYIQSYIRWPGLCIKFPSRSILIIATILPLYKDKNLLKKIRDTWGDFKIRFSDEDKNAFTKIAKSKPDFVWREFITKLEKLTLSQDDEIQEEIDDWSNIRESRDERSLISLVVELLIISGKELIISFTEDFLKDTEKFRGSHSQIIQQILIEIYSQTPETHSDFVVEWFILDSKRLSIGSGYNEPKNMPGVRLVSIQSTSCSKEVFNKLEHSIMHYIPQNEISATKYAYQHSWFKNGYIIDHIGRSQYFLLPALDKTRRSHIVAERINVLNRKFDVYDHSYFTERCHIMGGVVGSTIRQPSRVSDKSWISIISNSALPVMNGKWKKQIDPDHVTESSIFQFSRSLRSAATKYPERFAQLLLKFSKEIHHSYISAIFDGVNSNKPLDLADEELHKWEPANIVTIEKCFVKFAPLINKDMIFSICRLIQNRSDESWSESTIDMLISIAVDNQCQTDEIILSYDSGEYEELNKASIKTLESNAVIHERGVVIETLGKLLYWHNELFDKLKPIFYSLTCDSDLLVLTSVLKACAYTLNFNRDFALEIFTALFKRDIRLMACQAAVYYFNTLTKYSVSIVEPIILEMIQSNNEEVVEEGAMEVCARNLFWHLFEEELSKCINGSLSQRKGVTKIATQFISDQNYHDKCVNILMNMDLNDTDKTISDSISKSFNNNELLYFSNISIFLEKYVLSNMFINNPYYLIHAFEEYSGSLVPFKSILELICFVVVEKLSDESRNIMTGVSSDISDFSKIVLRLYEQSKDTEDADTMDKCLSIIDDLLYHRLGIVYQMIKEIDEFE
ncbi:MAG: ATP-binding protein [Candidatus Neomarinimicrobiota bacterium]